MLCRKRFILVNRKDKSFDCQSSLHWLILLSNCSFLYNVVYWVDLMLSICDIIVSQKLIALRKTKYKGKVPKGDWLNYPIKIMVTWYDQVIIEMFIQQDKHNIRIFIWDLSLRLLQDWIENWPCIRSARVEIWQQTKLELWGMHTKAATITYCQIWKWKMLPKSNLQKSDLSWRSVIPPKIHIALSC